MPRETFDLDAEIEKMRHGIPPSDAAVEFVRDLKGVIERDLSAACAAKNFIDKYGVSPSAA